MKVFSIRTAALFVLVAAAALTGAPARAGLDIDLGATIRFGDDTELYFAISSRYFGQEPRVVQNWAARYGDPDDLAVALYICKRSGRDLDAVFSLRRRGMSWSAVAIKAGLPVDVWFVAVQRDPGPPYGKAYGHWKNHKRNSRHVVVLSDADVRNLVAVRVLHEYYGVSVEMAMEWRASGRNLRALVADQYRTRHGKPSKAATAGKSSGKPGKGNNGRGRGKSK